MAIIKIGNKEVNLLEYEGKYRLEVGRMGQDKEGKPRWWANRVREVLWKDGQTIVADKDSNVKIQLGEKATAVAALRSWADQIEAGLDEAPF